MNEPRITAVEITGEIIDLGAAACKAMPPGHRHRYVQKQVYTLEDGRKFEGHERATTKPKLKEKQANTAEHVAKGWLFAWLDGDKFIGTSMRCTLSELCK